MKRLIPFLLIAGTIIFINKQASALPVAIKPIQKNGIENLKKSSDKKKDYRVKKMSKRQQKRLDKKVGKFQKKLMDRGVKLKDYGSFSDVFGERYFILGVIFLLVGIALGILGAITSIGLLGWFGGLAILVGLVLMIIAIIQVL